MLECGIGRAHNLALASLPNFSLPGDISASKRYWARDVITKPFEVAADGTVEVPTGPGIGVDIDHAFLDRGSPSNIAASSRRSRHRHASPLPGVVIGLRLSPR